MRPVTPAAMAAALVVSAGSMLAHNLYELPLAVTAIENAGPIAFAALLGVAYTLRPSSRVVAVALLAWGLLNLVVGGVVSVLPLPVLPFVPEQSLTHYGAHVVYTLGQVPLVIASWRAVRRTFERRPARAAGAPS
jgi:peptidoglycan/LPS O-acetylase OafA/YrhL